MEEPIAATSGGQRLSEKRQALIQPVIDIGMIVGELLIAMGNTELVQPPHEPTGTVEQIELILLGFPPARTALPGSGGMNEASVFDGGGVRGSVHKFGYGRKFAGATAAPIVA